MAEEKPLIYLRDVYKSFNIGQPNELEILHGINLDVYEGEFVAIVGQSGCGKSTLMNIIGALDRPTSGIYKLAGLEISKAPDEALSAIRCRMIGFVFQTFNLIPRNSALKNVELPMMYAGVPMRERQERAKSLLDLVEMGERIGHQPNELSGGQKQRVAIARAMANDPAILLADEPTGALDSNTGRLVMDLFHRLNKEQGKTILFITHNQELAEECDRIVPMKDGYLDPAYALPRLQKKPVETPLVVTTPTEPEKMPAEAAVTTEREPTVLEASPAPAEAHTDAEQAEEAPEADVNTATTAEEKAGDGV